MTAAAITLASATNAAAAVATTTLPITALAISAATLAATVGSTFALATSTQQRGDLSDSVRRCDVRNLEDPELGPGRFLLPHLDFGQVLFPFLFRAQYKELALLVVRCDPYTPGPRRRP